MRFSRTERLLGAEAMDKLGKSKVAVFGIGGVGSYVVEALARSGVGALLLVDADKVSESNINRQLIALTSTVGMLKTEAAASRVKQINPDAKVETAAIFYGADTEHLIDLSGCSYVVDAIDSVTSKLLLIKNCKQRDIPIISVMGAGNKLHPEMFKISDISATSVCPLARVMRKELKAMGIYNLKVVYSEEQPIAPLKEEGGLSNRPVPASIAFVPSAAGLIAAGEVVRYLIK